MSVDHLNYFSDRERRSIKRLARIRTVLVRRLVPFLQWLRLTPNRISCLGLSLLLPVVLLFDDLPLVAAGLLVAYILLDAIDGAFARLTGMSSQHGALVDITVDQLGMIVVALCSIHYGLVHPTLGAYYVVAYLLMICLSVWQNAMRIPVQPIFRSKYFLYGLYLVWGLFDIRLFNYLVPVFAGAHTVSGIHSFIRILQFLQRRDAERRKPGSR